MQKKGSSERSQVSHPSGPRWTPHVCCSMTEGFRFLAWHDSRTLPIQLRGPLAILQPLQDSVHSSFFNKSTCASFSRRLHTSVHSLRSSVWSPSALWSRSQSPHSSPFHYPHSLIAPHRPASFSSRGCSPRRAFVPRSRLGLIATTTGRPLLFNLKVGLRGYQQLSAGFQPAAFHPKTS